MIKLKHAILLVSMLLSALLSESQNVSIEAESNVPDELIRVMVFPDMVSWKGNLLAQARSDRQGNFKIQFTVESISYIRLYVGLESVGFYVKPASSYEILIQCHENQGLQSYFEKVPPALVFHRATDNMLQEGVSAIDQTVNAFLLKHFDDLYRRQRTDLIDSLSLELMRKYDPQHAFLRQYATYKIASSELAVQRQGARAIAEKYYVNHDVQYNMMSYMDLLHEVFGDYFLVNRKYSAEGFREAFRKDFPAFRNYLRNDPMLSEDNKLNELIILINLQQLFNTQGFDKKITLKHLAFLKQYGLFAENKNIASNLIHQLQLLEPGTNAPLFALNDANGKTNKLIDYQDQIVVLHFINSYCSGCEASFAQLEQIQKKYTTQIQVITIATEESFAEYVKLFSRNEYSWPLLNLDGNILLLEEYQVRTFPEFIVIGKSNKIALAPASSPDQYLDIQLSKLLK